MKLTSLERESVFVFNQAERNASIFTYNAALQEQLSELCTAYPDRVRQTAANGFGGLTFELPKKWLRIVPPRVLSPAQRAVIDRMNQNRNHSTS